jgi:xylose isomerase
MTSANGYQPRAEDKFSFGLWTVGNPGRDLVPIDATAAERDCIVRRFKQACESHGIVVPMATVSLFFHPVSTKA